jgi:hypothetical protein
MNGKGWVDPNSMQVLRIEMSTHYGAPPEDTAQKTELDYGAVNIDGKVYWLLTKLSRKPFAGGDLAAEYSECRKFEVNSQIRPVQ